MPKKKVKPESAANTQTLAQYKSSCTSETAEQIKVMQWKVLMINLGYTEFKELFHVPNGGKRDKKTAGIFKAMGVESGIPDLFFLVPHRGYHGAIIELKRTGNGTSEEQDVWIERFRERGFFVRTCWCDPIAERWLEWYAEITDQEPTKEEGKWE